MAKLRVEVVYALPDGHDCVWLWVDAGTTLAEAVAASGIAARHADLRGELRLGVHGKQRDVRTPVRAGERIEIYRPLLLDPKEARRARAARRSRRP